MRAQVIRHSTISTDYADRVLGDLRSFADHDLPNYSECLRTAFAATEPVFVRARYGQFFWHCATSVPGWLPRVVLANAEAESQGSEKLQKLWQGILSNDEVACEVLLHAEDEAGHSRLFVELAHASFPDSLSRMETRTLKKSLTKLPRSPKQSSVALDENTVIDHLVQMNIGEIRTRAHMHLLGPAVFTAAPDENQFWVEQTLERLGGDEVRHIGYTARHMENWCSEGAKNEITRLYTERLREFHAMTVAQIETAVHSYSQGLFPDLLEI